MNRSAEDKQTIAIQALAFHVPERVLSNSELAEQVDTSDEWIVSHTGIRQRHIAGPEEACSDLALQAAHKVLQKGGLQAQQIDLIVLATATPDYSHFPATACVVQHKLGCGKAAAFDLTAACSGFIYALEVARAMLWANSSYSNALVLSSEVFSKIVNWEDRSTCVLFGDGAGAALLSRNSAAIQVLDTLLKADGSGAENLWVPCGGSRHPITVQGGKPRNRLEMNGRAVYNFAIAASQDILHEMLERNHLSISDLRYIVPHQANLRIVQALAKREGIPMECFYTNIANYANTSAASIPIALAELEQQGQLRPGDYILCIGFGAGLTSAGALLQWS